MYLLSTTTRVLHRSLGLKIVYFELSRLTLTFLGDKTTISGQTQIIFLACSFPSYPTVMWFSQIQSMENTNGSWYVIISIFHVPVYNTQPKMSMLLSRFPTFPYLFSAQKTKQWTLPFPSSLGHMSRWPGGKEELRLREKNMEKLKEMTWICCILGHFYLFALEGIHIYLSIYLSVYLSVYLSIYLYLSIYPSIYLSLCTYTHAYIHTYIM